MGLDFAVVAEVAHADGSGVWAVVSVPAVAFECGGFGFEVGFVDCGRGAEEVGVDPSDAQEIAHEMKIRSAAEIFFSLIFGRNFCVQKVPKFFREREIIVGARNGLHFFAVTGGEAFAVFGAFFGAIGLAVFGNFDVFFIGQTWGHAEGPNQFVGIVFVDEAMKGAKEIARFFLVFVRWSDEFELGFGEIGREVGVS